MRKFSSVLLLVLLVGFIFSSCRKDKLLTDGSAKLSFAADTLTFDTVFTTLGSTTEFIRVYNKNNGKVNIDEIRLGGGSQSPFRLNVDGVPGSVANDVELNGKDSMYIFVAVTIDPTNQKNPIFFIDSIMFQTNGNLQKVYLIAWGQDAHFFISEEICTQTWTNDKPYVILNSMAIDSGCTLTINPGCKIYFGGNSSLYVYATGKIIVNGTQTDSVNFRNVRLEKFYQDKAGQWGGIFLLRGSTGNQFNYAEISNSTYGLQLGNSIDTNVNNYTFANRSEATIKNCIIRSSLRNGIFCFYSELNAENCLIYEAGDNMAVFGMGGKYTFTHCTFANYGSNYLEHKKASLLLSNVFYNQLTNTAHIRDIDAQFTNCIIYGSIDEEIDTSIADPATSTYSYKFKNCLLKTERNINNTTYFENCKKNEDPQFKDRADDDYRITDTSPCRDAGIVTSVTTDLDGFARDGTPDMGCYEYQP
jgi:hypothetical protein